jgi:hypothetical protein
LDDCGDPTIFGSHGHITACDGVVSIYLQCRSARAWTFAKRMLSGICPTVSQDGDEEGILRLDRLPTSEEAELIRHYVGIRQTAPAETRERIRSHQRRFEPAKTGTLDVFCGMTGPAGI